MSAAAVNIQNRLDAEVKWPSTAQEPVEWNDNPNSMTRRINGESILLLGWGRAVLLQIAHPMVAEGVSQHSYFSKSTIARLKRTERTLGKMLEMTYGDRQQAWAAASHIDQIHAHINGHLSESNGPYQVGQEYSARMSDLLKWVHCTFVDSMLKIYELYVTPLSTAEKDLYVNEVSISGPMLGAPSGFYPTTYTELQTYLAEMLTSGKIVVSNKARDLEQYVLAPLIPLPILDKLLNWYLLLPVCGLMPDFVRESYGLRWTNFDRKAWKFQIWTYRHLLRPILPKRVRRFPVAIKGA